MALKENYKDDILDVSVNTKRKYRMTENPDGTISLDDETVYTQEGDSFGASDMNATNGKVNALETDIGEINDNLSGFKFYPKGTGIVGLISDDSAYTDADGNYVVWGTATAEQLVEDNPNTYKAVASTEDTRGKVGADTATPFNSGGLKNMCIVCSGYAGAAMGEILIDNLGYSSFISNTSSPISDDTFQVTYDGTNGYIYNVYAKKAGKYRIISNITGSGTSSSDMIVDATVGQLLAKVNGSPYSQYNPIWGIVTIQYL